jgi:23S rRNA (cytidine1920-2'-O)/16S rRNA (cytidine1409-2'-O)-methyltransferase
VAWTKQRHILPAARRMLADDGAVVTLIKPHYEADAALLRKGILPEEAVDEVVRRVEIDVNAAGFTVIGTVRSPIKGAKGNAEVLAYLKPA